MSGLTLWGRWLMRIGWLVAAASLLTGLAAWVILGWEDVAWAYWVLPVPVALLLVVFGYNLVRLGGKD